MWRDKLHLLFIVLAVAGVLDVARARPSEGVEPLELLDYSDWEASERQKQEVEEGSPGSAGSEGTFGSWWSERRPCTCGNMKCGCCTGKLFPLPPWLRPRMCTNLTYIQDEFAIKMAVTFNDVVMYRNKLSGRNPPPVCLSPPRIPRAQLCIKLQDVYLVERNIHACMSVEGLFNKQVLFGRTLGCMRMGSNGFAVVNPEDGGGLPPVDAADPDDDEEPNDEDDYDQVDEDYDQVEEDNTVESGAADGDQAGSTETATQEPPKKKGTGATKGVIAQANNVKDTGGSTSSVKKTGAGTSNPGTSNSRVTGLNKGANQSPASDNPIDKDVIGGTKTSVKTAAINDTPKTSSNKVLAVSNESTSADVSEAVDSHAINDSVDVAKDEASTSLSNTIHEGLASTPRTQEEKAESVDDEVVSTQHEVTVGSEEENTSEESPETTTEVLRKAEEQENVATADRVINKSNLSEKESEESERNKLAVNETKESGEANKEEVDAESTDQHLGAAQKEDVKQGRGFLDEEIVGIGTVEVL